MNAAQAALLAALLAALWSPNAAAEPVATEPTPGTPTPPEPESAPASPEPAPASSEPAPASSDGESAPSTAAPAPEPHSAFPGLSANSLGALSIGHPHEGYLMNAMRMPTGKYWTVALPEYAFGTEETIAALIRCITLVNQRFPNTPKVVIGSISKENGGRFPPHKSHQSGRDADVGFYYNPGFPIAKPATRENLDVERTWALVRAFITETDVDMILIDTKVQRLLEVHALRRGEDPVWLKSVFHGTGSPYSSLIKHAPGHAAHMHIRFSSPIARERGKNSYTTLVEQGHVELRRKELRHRVGSGETLTGIARKYRVGVEALIKLNRLDSTKIRVGQTLLVQEPEHLRGAFDPIVVPKRRLPEEHPQAARATNLTATSPASLQEQ